MSKLRLMLAALAVVGSLVAIPAANAGRSNFIEYGYGDPAPHCSGGPFSAPGCNAYLF